MEKNTRLEKQILQNREARSQKKQAIAERRKRKHDCRMNRKAKGKQRHSEKKELKRKGWGFSLREAYHRETYYPPSSEDTISLGRYFGTNTFTFSFPTANGVQNF